MITKYERISDFMFFFSKKEDIIAGHCEVCGFDIIAERDVDSKEIVTQPKYKTADDKYICPQCLGRYNCPPKKVNEKTLSEIYSDSKKINKSILLPDEFHFSKVLYGLICFTDDNPEPARTVALAIDEDKQKILFTHLINKKGTFSSIDIEEVTRNMSDLVDFELLDSGNTKISGASILGGMAGGVVAGGFGALIGSNIRDKKVKEKCTSLLLKVIFNDVNNPEEYIHFIDGPGHAAMGRNMSRQSKGYLEISKLAQQCVSLLTIIMKRNKDTLSTIKSTSIPSSIGLNTSNILETIKKLGDLHNAGILTDEEFSKKKAELLSRI